MLILACLALDIRINRIKYCRCYLDRIEPSYLRGHSRLDARLCFIKLLLVRAFRLLRRHFYQKVRRLILGLIVGIM